MWCCRDGREETDTVAAGVSLGRRAGGLNEGLLRSYSLNYPSPASEHRSVPALSQIRKIRGGEGESPRNLVTSC